MLQKNTLIFQVYFLNILNLIETLLPVLALSCAGLEPRNFSPTAYIVTALGDFTQPAMASHVRAKACKCNTANVPGLDKQKNTNQCTLGDYCSKTCLDGVQLCQKIRVVLLISVCKAQVCTEPSVIAHVKSLLVLDKMS